MVVNLEVSYHGDTRTVPVDNSCSLFDLREAVSVARPSDCTLNFVAKISNAFAAPLTLTVLVGKQPINSDAELLLVLARVPVPPVPAVAAMEHPHPEGIAERPLDLQDNSSASLQPLLLPDTQRVVDTLVTQIAESAENEEHNSSHLSSDAQRIARKSSQDTYNDEAQHYEHGSDGFAQTVATAVRYSMAGSPGGSIQQANVSKSGAISRRHLACTWANDIKSLISNHKREHKRKLSKIRDEDAEF
ncbi:hypothetical protein HDU83_003934, partial [Entophlyctis luteolus]